MSFYSAVFAEFVLGYNRAPERIAHKLHTVANAEHRNAQRKYFGVAFWRFIVVNAVGTAGKDYSDRRHMFYFVHRHFAGLDNRIHAALAHAPGDKFFVLPAEVKHQHGLVVHKLSSSHNGNKKSVHQNANFVKLSERETAKEK